MAGDGPHLWRNLFGVRGASGSSRKAEQALGSGLLSPRSCLRRHVVPWRGLPFGFRFLLTSMCGFCQGDPKVPSSHCSHIRRMSSEERLLLGLPHRSRQRRHNRSVKALVSLCEVTPDKAAERQRAQASSAAFGVCVRSGTRVGGSGWIAPGATRCRPGGGEAGV